MPLAATALLTLIVGASTVAGQDAAENVFLFEKSYAALGTPDVIDAPAYYYVGDTAERDLLAEAQLGVHVPLVRRLGRAELRDGGPFSWNLFLTPQFRLRALDVESGPVKSISFMPKFTLQLVRAFGRDRGPQLGWRHVAGVNFVLGHHSNGGSTCVFTDEDHNTEGECMRTAIPPAQREVRVKDGNFSTNYLELGFGYRIGHLEYDSGDYEWTRLLDVALSHQYHHNWIGLPVPGGAVDAFAALYGRDRSRIDLAVFSRDVSWLDVRGHLRLDRAWRVEERFAGSRNFTIQSEISVSFPSYSCLPESVRLGIRYSRGMDYYNTQFVRDISFVQLVVLIDPWTPKLWS